MACRLPLVVPAVQPIELSFFQRVFQQLRLKQEGRRQRVNLRKLLEGDGTETVELSREGGSDQVPVADFQRAMVRLFRVIRDKRRFNAAEYHHNRSGKVGWYEFCSLWRDRGVYARLSLAEQAFLTLEDADRSLLGKAWSMLVFGAILVSTVSFVLSTLPEYQVPCPGPGAADYDPGCRPQARKVFDTIDLTCIILFTAEYLVRLILSAFMRSELIDSEKSKLLTWMVRDAPPPLLSKISRVFQWVTHWANIIDLSAILPWYLTAAFQSSGGGQSAILKIIRLSRVIRAFRLGRRFEAVIVIMRSVRRSLRAVTVLVLNLCLGMIFFGSLMYFAEQGSWDPVTKAYLRWDDATTQSKSPFESIPACFWWAIVTATTVGYGDDHTPTTLAGRLVAGFSMIWSLCVLALPIGVIGGNFSQVWEEFYRMKDQERQNVLQEALMLEKAVAWGDPLYQCRQLVLEVWHDSGLSSDPRDTSQSEFLGEVCWTMEIGPNEPVMKRRLQLPLAQNYDKARRKVRGSLTFEYSWQPLVSGKCDTDMLLEGVLEVNVVSAENIVQIDWNGPGATNPFCTVTTYPSSPDEDGSVQEAVHRGPTLYDTIMPVWDTSSSFDMCWTKAASRRRLVAEMSKSADLGLASRTSTMSTRRVSTVEGLGEGSLRRASTSEVVGSAGAGQLSEALPRRASSAKAALGADTAEPTREDMSMTNLMSNANRGNWIGRLHQEAQATGDGEVDAVLNGVSCLQEEVVELRTALPQLRAEIASVRRDLQLALAAFERQSMPPCAAGQPGVGEGARGGDAR